MKTLPTERLARVVNEGATLVKELVDLRVTLSQVLNDWGAIPDESRLAELRLALDKANSVVPLEIPIALAYLKANARQVQGSRNRSRKRLGLGPRNVDLGIPEDAGKIMRPAFSLEEIEAKLGALGAKELINE